ncbi:hypothetical protein HAX54_014747, partial [Datura stramonium]|nr:hypothetical protein [Datura stramonium]
MEEHGLKWFNAQKEESMLQKTGLMRVALHLSSLSSAKLSVSWGWDMCLPILRNATSH